jgi:uncharacterized protein (DUF433 family)
VNTLEKASLKFHAIIDAGIEMVRLRCGMVSNIVIDPNICHGNPVIRGTRVLVSQILGALAGGDTVDNILEDYPGLTREDIYATLCFAGELVRFETSAYNEVLA